MIKITIIAEAGICHNGDMHLAKALIREAKWAGCDIWKTQVYSVDALFPDHQIMAQGKNWYEEVKRTELTKKQTFELADYCAGCRIEFMASAWDEERLSWLEECGVKRHKIGTRAIRNFPLIAKMLATKKQVILSVPYGKSSILSEKGSPITYKIAQSGQVKLLYCIPEYPTPAEHISLSSIDWKYYDGWSDHTIGIEASMEVIKLGAKIVEKHFSLDPSSKAGPDHICSTSPQGMRQLVEFARKV